jgi:DNA ligase D-like protein (predicted ligase)
MLAKSGTAFDSPQWQFEIKWDGTRALAYVDRGTVRLMNRRRVDIAYRFPELACLRELPDGTVLDGEVVVLLGGGKPDFEALQTREHASVPLKIGLLAKSTPATYVVFDQLFDRFKSVMDRPLTERREILRRTLVGCDPAHVVMTDAVVGTGVACFDAVVRQGMEGVVAKKLDGRYWPGKRSDCWLKIKRHENVQCAVVGYEPEGERDFKALVLAAEVDGALAYVGKVGTGFDAATRAQVTALLLRLASRAQPVVACRGRAVWVEPELYCEVRCMERTRAGALRAPVFVRLLLPGAS